MERGVEVSPLLLELFFVGLRISFNQVLQLRQVVGQLVVLPSGHSRARNQSTSSDRWTSSRSSEVAEKSHAAMFFCYCWSTFELRGTGTANVGNFMQEPHGSFSQAYNRKTFKLVSGIFIVKTIMSACWDLNH